MGGLHDEKEPITIGYHCEFERAGVPVREASTIRCYFNGVSVTWSDPKVVEKDAQAKISEIDQLFHNASPDEISKGLENVRERCAEVKGRKLVNMERTRFQKNAASAAMRIATESQLYAWDRLCACATATCANDALRDFEVEQIRRSESTCYVQSIAWSRIFRKSGRTWVNTESAYSPCYSTETSTLYPASDEEVALYFPDIWRGGDHWNMKVARVPKPKVDRKECRWFHSTTKGDHVYSWKPHATLSMLGCKYIQADAEEGF